MLSHWYDATNTAFTRTKSNPSQLTKKESCHDTNVVIAGVSKEKIGVTTSLVSTRNAVTKISKNLVSHSESRRLIAINIQKYAQWSVDLRQNALKLAQRLWWHGPVRQSDINLSPHSAANMRQLIESALVQIMACRLFGAKPLSISMLCYC